MKKILFQLLLLFPILASAQVYQFTQTDGQKRVIAANYILFVREANFGCEVLATSPKLSVIQASDTLGTINAATCGAFVEAVEEYQVGQSLRTRRLLVSRFNVERIDSVPGNKGLLTYRNPSARITIRGFSSFRASIEACQFASLTGANNQVAVFTADGGVGGSSRLTFDQSTRTIAANNDTISARAINAGFSSSTDSWMLRLLGRNDIGGPHFHHNWANSNFTQFTVNYGQMSVGFATPSTASTTGARAAFYKVLTASTKVDSALVPIANIPIAQMNVYMHRGQTSSLVSSGTVYDYSNGTRWVEAWVDSVAADGTVAVRSELYAKNTGGASIPTGTLGLRVNKFSNVVIPQQLMVGSTNNPSASAALQINSTTGALVLPRMTTAQRNALTPFDGMVIFCTDCTATDTSTGVSQTYSSSAWRNHY